MSFEDLSDQLRLDKIPDPAKFVPTCAPRLDHPASDVADIPRSPARGS